MDSTPWARFQSGRGGWASQLAFCSAQYWCSFWLGLSAGRTFAGYGGGDTLQTIIDQLNGTMARIREIEGRLTKWHRESRVSRLLATVPGVGIMGASAIAATVVDPSLFRSGREFAAWLGMTPRQNSSGGKERLGRTSKRGDKYIRSLLTAGAVAVLRHARNRPTRDGEWVRALLARKPAKLAAVALANKTARIVWAVMMRGEGYRAKEVFEQAA